MCFCVCVKRLAEDATNGYPGAPETRVLKIISRAAFEIDDYWRIAEILHKRFHFFFFFFFCGISFSSVFVFLESFLKYSFFCFRLVSFDRKNWWVSYKALIVLEHLLTHGPESFSEEFQSDKDVITEIGRFQHVDEKGYLFSV